MTIRINTLYKKMLLYGVLSLGLLGFVYHQFEAYLKTRRSSRNFQILSWDRTQYYLEELMPALGENYNEEKLRRIMGKLQNQHVWRDFFLLDKKGVILVHVPDSASQAKFTPLQQKSIDLEPIKDLLQRTEPPKRLIRGSDPYLPGKVRSFLAAKVPLKTGEGYLYILTKPNSRVLASPGPRIRWYYGYIIMMGATVLLLGLLLSTLFVQPLKRILAVVDRITKGDLSQRTDISGYDELAQLGKKINQMADTIESTVSKLKTTDKLQREMVSALSHDFGTPLFSAQAYLERLERGKDKLSEEQQNEFLGVALRNLERLRDLVSAFFELSKLDARSVVPVKEPFSILDVVTEELVPKLQPIAEQKRVTIKAEYDESLPRAVGDVRLIERVLTNLVTNAIHYNQPDGQVSVRLTENDGKITIKIKDSGIGIAEEDLPHVFDRFYRTDKARSSSSGGSGLGLAIVKKILEAHGEQITVQSELAVGTVFSFSLPVADTRL